VLGRVQLLAAWSAIAGAVLLSALSLVALWARLSASLKSAKAIAFIGIAMAAGSRHLANSWPPETLRTHLCLLVVPLPVKRGIALDLSAFSSLTSVSIPGSEHAV